MIIPVKTKARSGWDEQFKKMSANKDDQLLINDMMDFDLSGLDQIRTDDKSAS